MTHAQAQDSRVEWEGALVQRACAGDTRAFERLYREHAGRVYGLCLRMTRDVQLAEDCTQDTFINAWRALAKFETRSSLSTWLHRIAVNVSLAKRRNSPPSADIRVSGVLGVQRLNAVSGDVTSELAGADVDAKTVSGELRLKGHGQGGRLHVSSVSGDVHLEHGGGDFEASTVSGTLVVSLDNARAIRSRSTSGDLRLEAKLTRGATLDATSVSGGLNVRASADGGYAYEVSTFSGDISDCFDAKAERTGKYAPGRMLQGTRGEGAGHVRLKTMSGDVQLCDRN